MSLGFFLIKATFKKSKKSKTGNIRFKKNRYGEVKSFIKNQFNNKEVDKVFYRTGLNITSLQYQMVRYLIFIILLVLMILSFLNTGIISIKNYIMLLALFLISSPVLSLGGKKTPFSLLIDALQNEYKNKKDVELYRAISQLKNIAIAQKDKPLSSDFIIEQLIKFTKLTKKDFIKLLSEFRLGNEETGCREFASNVDTRLALELSNVLIKLDKINPIELKEQLTLYQENLKAERMTKKLKRNETISNIIFIPIISLALIVLLNFVIIVIFLDQMQNIMNL